jgi:hypothetical protein
MRQMKLSVLGCIIAGASLFADEPVPVPIPTEPGPKIDTAYVELLTRSEDIEIGLAYWNENCKPIKGVCVAIQKILLSDMAKYIIDARNYKSEGEGCSAAIRQKLIQRTIDIYSWNLNCAGRATKPCVFESKRIDDGKAALEAEMTACRDEKL